MPDTEPMDEYRMLAEEFLSSPHGNDDTDRLAALLARTARSGLGGNNPPTPIDIENLVDPDALPPVLGEKYAGLVKRSADLTAAATRWREGHTDPVTKRLRIADELDNQRTADFLRQIAVFAGGANTASGAVNDARERVKGPLLNAGRLVDAWFNRLREELRTFAADVTRIQTAYLRDKAAAEQAKRAEEARQAEAAAEEARRTALATDGDPRAVDEAIRTTEIAERTLQQAAAPAKDMARSTSMHGTTTTLRSNWTYRVISMLDLAKAVAEGRAPVDFLTTQDRVIRAAIQSGRRECDGLEIWNDERAVRTGRTS